MLAQGPINDITDQLHDGRSNRIAAQPTIATHSGQGEIGQSAFGGGRRAGHRFGEFYARATSVDEASSLDFAVCGTSKLTAPVTREITPQVGDASQPDTAARF